MAENLSADRSKMLGCLQNEGKFRNTNSNIEVFFYYYQDEFVQYVK